MVEIIIYITIGALLHYLVKETSSRQRWHHSCIVSCFVIHVVIGIVILILKSDDWCLDLAELEGWSWSLQEREAFGSL